MNWDVVFIIAAWGTLLFVWMPRKNMQHRKRMRSLRAMNKGYRFMKKYKAIRALTGRPS